jgi:hypothetical protein
MGQHKTEQHAGKHHQQKVKTSEVSFIREIISGVQDDEQTDRENQQRKEKRQTVNAKRER